MSTVNISEWCANNIGRSNRHVIREACNIKLADAAKVVMAIGEYIAPNFTIDEDNKQTYKNLLTWCLSQGPLDINKGIYLWGNTGTGKTLALAVLRNVCRYFNIRADYGGEVHGLAWTTVHANEICDEYEENGNLSSWVDIPCLCINDLGTEPAETLYMGNRRRVLRTILEQRADRADRLTLITSNYPPNAEEISDMYGARVVSRINQMFNICPLFGPDRRNS